MAATTITTAGASGVISQEGLPAIGGKPDVIRAARTGDEYADRVLVKYGSTEYWLDISDGVTIDGETFSGTQAQLVAAVTAVFFKANSGSGGSGSGDIILESPDGTLWLVGVSNTGALETSETESGTPSTPTLTAPDNSQWSLGVNNAGALITTAI